jgi:hypothetical protein
MPYASEYVVGTEECVSCKEPAYFNCNGYDNEDAYAVVEMCEELYAVAGNCESNLDIYIVNSTTYCKFIEGIQMYPIILIK